MDSILHFYFTLTEVVKNFRVTQLEITVKSWACLTGYRAGKGSKPNFLICCTAQNAWLPVKKQNDSQGYV